MAHCGAGAILPNDNGRLSGPLSLSSSSPTYLRGPRGVCDTTARTRSNACPSVTPLAGDLLGLPDTARELTIANAILYAGAKDSRRVCHPHTAVTLVLMAFSRRQFGLSSSHDYAQACEGLPTTLCRFGEADLGTTRTALAKVQLS